MLHNTKGLYGAKLAASDGDIGQVKDFYFDDKTWMIRYLVADIVLGFQAKYPGPKMQLRPVDMRFNYRESFAAPSPDASRATT